MVSESNWYNTIIEDVAIHRRKVSRKDYKKYKLDLFLRMAKRVSDHSDQCGDCRVIRRDISKLAKGLSKEDFKQHLNGMNTITQHLKEEHELVRRGQFTSIGLFVGVGLGALMGGLLFLVLENLTYLFSGIALGAGIGLSIGSNKDAKAKKDGLAL